MFVFFLISSVFVFFFQAAVEAQSNIVHELKEIPPVPASQVGFKSTSNMLVLKSNELYSLDFNYALELIKLLCNVVR